VETRTDDPDEAPVIVFVHNGGYGCSSLTSMFMNTGPWVVDPCGSTFYENEYSWNNRASVLYLDGLPGVGYSFGKDEPNKRFNDVQSSLDFFDALQHFFLKFPKMADNPIYLAGETFGGITVPYLAWRIHEYNTNAEITKKTKIPFKGIIVGNGLTNWDVEPYNSLWPTAYMHNIMD
jgi:carboxypeptidase C (cathepsin A)